MAGVVYMALYSSLKAALYSAVRQENRKGWIFGRAPFAAVFPNIIMS